MERPQIYIQNPEDGLVPEMVRAWEEETQPEETPSHLICPDISGLDVRGDRS